MRLRPLYITASHTATQKQSHELEKAHNQHHSRQQHTDAAVKIQYVAELTMERGQQRLGNRTRLQQDTAHWIEKLFKAEESHNAPCILIHQYVHTRQYGQWLHNGSAQLARSDLHPEQRILSVSHVDTKAQNATVATHSTKHHNLNSIVQELESLAGSYTGQLI